MLAAVLAFAVTVNNNPSRSPTASSKTNDSSLTASDVAVGGMGMVVLLMFVAGGLGIYAIPTIIAFSRGHQNAAAIVALNILLGWTFLGWVASLVWSLTEVKSRDHRHYHYGGH